MKRILAYLAAFAALVTAFSCTKENKPEDNPQTESGITLNVSQLELMVTETAELQATLSGEAEGLTVKWSSSDRDIARVSKGKVTAKAEGECTITASAGQWSATCNVTVTPYDDNYVPVVEITLSESEVTIVEGRTATVTASYLPENASKQEPFVWKSADESVATVEGGVITAVKAGETQISASGANHSATVKVTVIADDNPTTQIVFDQENIVVALGKTKTIGVTFLPEDHTDLPELVWSTSDANVATVENGVVTGKAEGSAVITAEYGSVKASCNVTVNSYAITTVANMYKNYLPISWSDASKTVVSSLSAITVEWLMNVEKWTNDNGNTVTTIFGIEGQWLIRIGDIPIKDNQLELAQNGGNWDSSNGIFDANKWYHVALVQNGTGLKLYVNGTLVETGTARRTIPSLANNCYISYSYDSSRYIQGCISEVRVWSDERTASEISDNMYGFSGTDDSLVAYWKFDEGEGNLVHDYSGNGNNLTAANDISWVSVELPEK